MMLFVPTSVAWLVGLSVMSGVNLHVGGDSFITLTESQKVVSPQASRLDVFGSHIGASGEVFVSVSHNDIPGIPGGGVGYAYSCGESSWEQTMRVVAADAQDNGFGSSIARSGRVVAIGAYKDPKFAQYGGAAYVFAEDLPEEWLQVGKLYPSDPKYFAWFGSAIAVSGDVILVGAYRDTHAGGLEAGAAYVFRRRDGQWVEQAKLVGSDPGQAELFGWSLGVGHDVVAVSSLHDQLSGSVFVFRWNGSAWSEEARLTSSDGMPSDYFGYSLSILDDSLLVGAPYDHHDGGVGGLGAEGSAYLFRRINGAWVEVAKLVSPAPEPDAFFGGAVSLTDGRLVVTAPQDDAGVKDSGVGYVFEAHGGNWLCEYRLKASDAGKFDIFGASTEILGTQVIVGAPGDNHNGVNAGSVYTFQLPTSDQR